MTICQQTLAPQQQSAHQKLQARHQQHSWCPRKLDRRSVSKRKEAMAYYSIESGAALLISLVINVCVVAVFAKGFHNPAHRGQAVGLENAGQYLGEAFGSQMKYVWAIGLLAAGAVPTMLQSSVACTSNNCTP